MVGGRWCCGGPAEAKEACDWGCPRPCPPFPAAPSPALPTFLSPISATSVRLLRVCKGRFHGRKCKPGGDIECVN